jgi:hypothetical protein
MNISESLRSSDLQNLVKKVFDIDAYKSKIGDDKDVIVLSFTVDHEDPAKDLENFVEMGYDFVLDADVSPGETDDGNYKVFIEIERSRKAPAEIIELLDGIERLTGMPDMRFRYFKEFKSKDATLENLTAAIPMDQDSYEVITKRHNLNNFSNFFSNSFAESIDVVNESITFRKHNTVPVTFKIVDTGLRADLYRKIQGPIMLESADIAEVLFFTKYIGNYNITKIKNTFVFENNGWAVAMEK